jgi:hypothetical protein
MLTDVRHANIGTHPISKKSFSKKPRIILKTGKNPGEFHANAQSKQRNTLCSFAHLAPLRETY